MDDVSAQTQMDNFSAQPQKVNDSQQKQNPLLFYAIAVGIGAVVGLVLGLLVGWVIWPVQWTDAAPAHLHPDYQEEWLRMAIDSYSVNQDAALATRRYEDLGEYGPETMAAVEAEAMPNQLAAIDAYQAAIGTTGEIPLPGMETTEVVPAETGGATRSPFLTVLFIMCGLTVIVGVVFAVIYFLRSRSSTPSTVTPAMQAQEAARQAEWTDYSTAGEEPPIAQFMASYKVGDDLFDDSFSIDSPNGEFLGECGVGISETIGVGDPKKVTAFEVWLFDKNDIQTVTKVLMSAHAFNDEVTMQRLSAKGEPVLAEPGSQAVLDTATLKLSARIVDMNYGEGALPENSFFDSMILEIAVWQKQA
jgi:heme/copper-type cytochrome/quinol oxidase subunit 2